MPPRAIDKPPPARNPAGGAIKRRPAKTSSGEGGDGGAPRGGQPGILKFYDQEAPGIKMTPVQVLVISVVFVSFVVVLHIYGKVRASAAAVEEE